MQIHLWIPIAVVQNDNVGRRQIDAKAAGARRQHEQELFAARRVKFVDLLLTQLVLSLTVEAAILVAAPPAIILENVEHSAHLREDENARALRLQLYEQFVEQMQLAAVLDEMLIGRKRRSRLGAVEEIRMIAAFAQMHENIHHARLLDLAGAVDNVEILHKNLRVPFALQLREADVDFDLLLRQKRLLDVRFDATQQERL